jgi:1-hydroxy-2-naphthoate dioxygenase
VTWVDVLDVPLVRILNQTFYQSHADLKKPVARVAGTTPSILGGLRPIWKPKVSDQMAVRYPWREVEQRLRSCARDEGCPHDGVALEYINPLDGGHTTPTMSAWIQWLKPGEKGQRHRHTSSAVYFVVRGEGRTVVGSEELQWKARDCFVVPNWSWHFHENARPHDEAILFSVNDIPTLEALKLYREETAA